MIPFNLSLKKTIILNQNPKEIKDLLWTINKILTEEGADLTTIENNRIKFRKLNYNYLEFFNAIEFLDSGYVELIEYRPMQIKIKYCFSLLRIWIFGTVFSMTVGFVLKNIVGALIAFSAITTLYLSYKIFRNWDIFQVMTSNIQNIDKSEP